MMKRMELHKIIITDTRSKWQIKEDNEAACFNRCPLFKYCSSRFGYDCKRLGGSKIPKIRGWVKPCTEK